MKSEVVQSLPIKKLITEKISGEWGSDVSDPSISCVAVIRTANFLNTGKIDFSNIVRRDIDQKKVNKKKLISGDIIIEKSGGSPKQPVGRVVLFENPDDDIYLCNNFTTILRPSRELIYPAYLFYVLFDNHQKGKTLRYQNKTTGIINLKIDNYLSSEIPLPPLADQKRIAHLLGKVDGLIARRKQHLQQLDDLLKSVFLEMFGDPVRNEKGWGTKTLPQLVLPGKHSLKRGPFGGALKKEIFVDSGYLVYEQNHALNNDYSFGRYFITEKKYNELIDFRVLPKDILISCSGVYLGKLSIVPEGARPGIINQALLKVSLNPEKIKHIFFVYVFASPQFKNKYFPSNRGGGIPNLPPMIEMKKIPFISPPIELQEEFAVIVEKVEGLKSSYQRSLADLERLYGVLSQKAFKGDLNLSRVPLPVEKIADDMDGTGSHRETKPFERGFARQLLAAEILHRYNHHDMTQMKLQKLIHLAEYHARLEEVQGEYQRQAAGPFDNRMMYGIDAGLKKQQWFEMHGQGQRATYSPLSKAGSHEKYLLRWQGNMPKIDEVLQLLGKARPDQCEIVSTLYAAWNDLLIDGAEITDETIIEQASKAGLWHKTKEAINPGRWPKALQWMRDHNLVPTGYGKHTRKLK